MTRSVWLAFTPRDSLFIRDGRAFDAGADNAARAVWPNPSTLAGAVGAALGGEPDEVRGPVLARRSRGGRWTPYFPVPADIVAVPDSGEVARLRPGKAPEGSATDLGDAVPCWLDAAGKAGTGQSWGGWLPGEELRRYLAGELVAPVARAGDVECLRETPVQSEPHVGLARTDEHTARPGFLYQAAHLRMADGWGFLAECVVSDGWDVEPRQSVPFGGRGRLAWVEVAGSVRWPQPPQRTGPHTFPDGRIALYVATPALWHDGWRPPLPDGAKLVAAAVPDAEPVATAKPGRGGARPTDRMLRWAVPAGSVYCLKFADAAAASAWALGDAGRPRVHGTAYGREPADRLRTAGFGVVLTGVWT
ncbi:type III-B CRISPR module-associated Cmr3 family protein [Streptomyces cyanogenus]|uniref:CRISPR-associated protein n=1 Tax=Streptomyces cyanogenus TaxID=80860 RepID=A0ABX7TUM1_STRCY|nr:type III-B CRISPR module-associated Cmr3 family protein [Streptomyces cyanogenus]QTD99987.1 CRISPR-associated protein [Streptomyces cyanogenus]